MFEFATCDFETTSEKFYNKHKYTKVWLACVYTEKKQYYFSNIRDFLIHCYKNNKVIYYFHNIKFDGSFIADFLLRNNLKYVEDTKKLVINSFSQVIDDRNNNYEIKINILGKKIRFLDSFKICPLSIEEIGKIGGHTFKGSIDYENYEINEKTKDYIKRDCKIAFDFLKEFFNTMNITKKKQIKMTIGSYAIKELNKYTEKVSRFYEKYRFGISYNDYKKMEQAYSGGFCQLNERYKEIELKNVYSVDINSAYPSCYSGLYEALPSPYFDFLDSEKEIIKVEEIDELIKRDKLFIVSVHFAHLELKNTIALPVFMQRVAGTINYIKNVDDFNACFTNYDYDIIKKCYNFTILKVNYIYIFDKWDYEGLRKYQEHFYNLKSKNTGYKKLIYKLFLNSVYGKMGTTPNNNFYSYLNKDNKIVYDEKNGIYKKFLVHEIDETTQFYYPLAIFITSIVRFFLINNILKIGNDFVYSDTDSIKFLNKENLKYFDLGKNLGQFEQEDTLIKAKFFRQKCYMGFTDNEKKIFKYTVAGFQKSGYKRIKNTFSNENDFYNYMYEKTEIGATFKNVKLLPKLVNGGTILKLSDFTIKEKLLKYYN